MTWASGKIALVTGASRGFGFASGAALAAAGAHVIAVARTTGGLEELEGEGARGRESVNDDVVTCSSAMTSKSYYLPLV